jgi:hypothetical protein
MIEMTIDQKREIADLLTGAWQMLNGQSLEPTTLKMIGRLLTPYGYDVARRSIEQVAVQGRRIAMGELIEVAKDVSGTGYPSPERALSLAMAAQDESVTVRTIPEIGQAWDAVRALNDGKHSFDHSKGFKEAYSQIVTRAEMSGKKPEWFMSLGHEPAAIRAERMQQIEQTQPMTAIEQKQVVAMIGQIKSESAPIAGAAAAQIAAMKAMFSMGAESLPEKQARLNAELAERKQRQIESLVQREAVTMEWPDPFLNPTEYCDAMAAAGRAVPAWIAGMARGAA